jgi:hypothetical protein
LAGAIVLAETAHTCNPQPVLVFPNIDARDQMRSLTEERAKSQLGSSAMRIANDVDRVTNDLYAEHSATVLKLTKTEIQSIVKYVRKQEFSGAKCDIIATKEYSEVGPSDPRLFLKFDFKYELFEGLSTSQSKVHRILMWEYPDLIIVACRREVPLFVDATFRSVPKGFLQYLIITCFDDETDTYIPSFFALMQDKSSWSYCHALHLTLVATNMKLKPATITTDFEGALLLACKEQFPESRIIGCLFHFKKALRRRLVKLRVNQEEIGRAILRGNLDILTTVERHELDETVSELQVRMCESETDKWDTFYSYFKNTWMKKFDFETWNISRSITEDLAIQTGRTMPSKTSTDS